MPIMDNSSPVSNPENSSFEMECDEFSGMVDIVALDCGTQIHDEQLSVKTLKFLYKWCLGEH